MKKARTRRKPSSRQQRLTTAVLIAPVLVVTPITDNEGMSFWQGLLVCVLVGAVWGLAVGATITIVRRVRTGAWRTTARR